MTHRHPLIAGNWKMNLNHLEAIALIQKIAFSLTAAQLSAVEVVVLPPFVDIRSVQTLVDGDKLLIGYGAQDLSPHDAGAYTGDISGPMLAKLGCRYAIVGHSERRQYHAEDDVIVNAKLHAALRHGLRPILCVGESLDVREAGLYLEHVRTQLDGGLKGLTAPQASTVALAYEPIWAIGTGQVATPQDAEEVCASLRVQLAESYSAEVADDMRILYGGSVRGSNAGDLLAQANIDGALVGGASLDAAEFAAICGAAAGG
ncbi:MAG TPA: triose-phosphate isomerase [Jatrophihabitantaceae bacterium]|nr:triose-phosphate isomerase [Jatrophihabitantaceae bacterium]